GSGWLVGCEWTRSLPRLPPPDWLPAASYPTPRPSSAHAYLSTSSTCTRNVGGRVIPRAAAVFRLTTNGNLSTRSRGGSAGFAPCRILWPKTAERWHSSRLSPP